MKFSKPFLISAIIFISLFSYIPAQAQIGDYTPLAPLNDSQNKPIPVNDIPGYLNGLFVLIIGLSGILAVIVIIYGGVLYMSTDAYTGKAEGKSLIVRALWGLLIIALSYIILYTINPNLVNLSNILKYAGSTQSGTGIDNSSIPSATTGTKAEQPSSIGPTTNPITPDQTNV